MLALPAAALTGKTLVIWIGGWSAALWVCVAAIAMLESKQRARRTLQEQTL
jgi:hypothetical protein